MCNSDAQSRHSQTTTRGASTQKKGETFPAILTASALCRRCNACTKNIPLYFSPSVPSSRCMHSLSNINCFFMEALPLAPHRASFDIQIETRSWRRVLIVLEEKNRAGRTRNQKTFKSRMPQAHNAMAETRGQRLFQLIRQTPSFVVT